MLKKRLIPVLLLKNGLLVRSEGFKIHQIIGNPIFEVKRFNEWNVDELIYIDISQDDNYDLGRDDHRTKGLDDPLTILQEVSKSCFMPLAWGGRIRSIERMREIFSLGADKVVLNTLLIKQPEIVVDAVNMFGSQAIVASIDVRKISKNQWNVVSDGGKVDTGIDLFDHLRKAESIGVGEILLQSVERDGSGAGYDIDLIRYVCNNVDVPVIACSGVS